VARRYATPVGEIDLVALKGTRLAFIEVKRRRTRDDAAFSVTAKQKRRIVRGPRHRIRRGSGRALELPAHHRQRVPGLAPKRIEAASPYPARTKLWVLSKHSSKVPLSPWGEHTRFLARGEGLGAKRRDRKPLTRQALSREGKGGEKGEACGDVADR
jgi:hypothetical protein